MKSDGFSFLLRTNDHEQKSVTGLLALSYECEFLQKGKERFYQIQREHLGRVTGHNGRRKSPGNFDYLVRRGSFAQILSSKATWIRLDRESISSEETLLSACGGPMPQEPTLASFQGYLSNWSIYDTILFDSESKVREPVVARHATRVEPSGSNLVNVLHTLYTGDRRFKKDLNAAMRAAFGDEFEELIFPPAADQRVQLRMRWRSLESEISAADLSAGTLQFLFLITVLMAPSPPSLVVIEEPEQYLHPAMLPIVAEHAVDAALRTQIVFTTHSPHFLDSFGATPPTTTVLECRQGKTHLETISGDRLEYWLQAYSLGRLFTSGVLESEL
jgi:predicted ATPase